MTEALTTWNNPRVKQKRYFPWLGQGHKASVDRYKVKLSTRRINTVFVTQEERCTAI